MPHIVLEGPIDLKDFYNQYRPFSQQQGGTVMKTYDIFAGRNHQALLIEALAVEAGPPNRFLVQVNTQEGKTTVRIYPGTNPEKTSAVKQILAMVAGQIKESNPEARYGPTNLAEYLTR